MVPIESCGALDVRFYCYLEEMPRVLEGDRLMNRSGDRRDCQGQSLQMNLKLYLGKQSFLILS